MRGVLLYMSEKALRVAQYIASHMNNPGDIREGVTVGDYEGVTFAAASPAGEGPVTVIVVAAAYAVRSEDDPLDQKFFPYP